MENEDDILKSNQEEIDKLENTKNTKLLENHEETQLNIRSASLEILIVVIALIGMECNPPSWKYYLVAKYFLSALIGIGLTTSAINIFSGFLKFFKKNEIINFYNNKINSLIQKKNSKKQSAA